MLMENYKFENYRARLFSTLQSIDQEDWNEAANCLYQAWKSGNEVFTAGNGGSASTSMHFATDWSKGLAERTGKPMKVRSLVTNLPLLTAISNDYAYEEVFAKQLSFFAGENSLLVLVSGSGMSKNILKAATLAKELKIKTISITGFDGGSLANLSDINVSTL